MRAHLRALALTLLLPALWLVPGSAPASAGLQTALEKVIGQQAAQALEEQYGTTTDPVLEEWVRRIGARVSASSPRQEVRYRFKIIEIEEPNALALPGGYIFVTRGLLDFVQDDDELAAIMAHEVGHVAAKHSVSHIKHQIVAALAISAVQERAGDTAGLAAAVLDAVLALQRSRHDEFASDQMGLEYAGRAGYDPAGLLSFFRKIQGSAKQSWFEALFATHPTPEMRIARANEHPFLKDPPADVLIAIGDRLAAESRLNRALEKYRCAERRSAGGTAAAGKIASVLALQGKHREAVALCLRAGLPPVPAAPAAPSVPLLSPSESEPARLAVAAALQDLNERQKQLNALVPRAHKGLRRTWDRHKWTTRLESAMAGTPQGLDYRWLYLALRAAALSAEIDRQIGAVSRAMRIAPAAMSQACAVCATGSREPGSMGALPRPLLSGVADEMERAGKESQQSLEQAMKALPDLDDADRLVASVMADLTSPYVIRWRGSLVHMGAAESFLQYAGLRLRRADERISKALRDATRARARAERARIDLAEATATPEERVVFRGLLRARLNLTQEALDEVLARGVSLGEATVMLLFTRSTSQPLARLEAAHQGNVTWIEAAEKLGLPVQTQAIILRLLYNTIAEERIHA